MSSRRRDRPTDAEIDRRVRRREVAVVMSWTLLASCAFGFWIYSFALEARGRFESLFAALDGR
jgi:hypothetical protein